MSRIDFEDKAVYDMLCRGDTIGIFQVESAAPDADDYTLRPGTAGYGAEVAASGPASGQWRRSRVPAAAHQKEAVTYDHPLEKTRAGTHAWHHLVQDQCEPVPSMVAGFNPGQADQLRRAFGRRHKRWSCSNSSISNSLTAHAGRGC